jgi:hypothetical protein
MNHDDKGLKLTAEDRAKHDAALDALKSVKRPGCACGALHSLPEAPVAPQMVLDLAEFLSKMTGDDLRVADRAGVCTIDPAEGAHTSEGCFKMVPNMVPRKRPLKDSDPCPGLCFKPGDTDWRFAADLEASMDELLVHRHRYVFQRWPNMDEARKELNKEAGK